MSATPIDRTSNIDVRLMRIESDVAHLGTAVGEIRLDLREVARMIDPLTPSSVTAEFRGEVRDLRADMRDLRVVDIRGTSRRVDHRLHGLIGSQAAAFSMALGIMAKGFHWI